VKFLLSLALVLVGAPAAHAADAGAPPAAATTKGTIVVPSSLITKAITQKDITGVQAVGADGKPIGVKMQGVSKYKTGLKDGDVIVEVSGQKVTTMESLIAVALGAVTNGAKKLSGKIVRGGTETWSVILELPSS